MLCNVFIIIFAPAVYTYLYNFSQDCDLSDLDSLLIWISVFLHMTSNFLSLTKQRNMLLVHLLLVIWRVMVFAYYWPDINQFQIYWFQGLHPSHPGFSTN